MKSPRVWKCMKDAYLRRLKLPFAERLVATLEAGQKAGGDIRGQQSSCLLIVSPKISKFPEMERVIDLRVEDNPQPIDELRRLLRLQRAYEWARKAPALMFRGDYEASARAYDNAIDYAPFISELRYWKAVSLASTGNLNETRRIFKHISQIRGEKADWKLLTQNLIEVGLFPANDSTLLEEFSNKGTFPSKKKRRELV